MNPSAARPLTLCHFTAIEVEPPAFVGLAARAGFAAVSLMIQFSWAYQPCFPMTGDTRMRRETRQRLDDTGVTLFDAATCRLEPDTGLEDFRAMVESAAYLGAPGRRKRERPRLPGLAARSDQRGRGHRRSRRLARLKRSPARHRDPAARRPRPDQPIARPVSSP